MDVSIESAPAMASSVGQSFPSSPTHPRKRAFSEVDEPNVSKPEAHKYQKHDNIMGEQENRNPLEPEPMGIDKPSVNTTTSIAIAAAADISNNTDIQNSHAKKATSTFSDRATPSADTQSPVPHSPPQKPSNAITPAPTAANKKQKLSPNSKEAKRLEKEQKDRLRLEEKAKKEEEKRIKEEEKKRKEAEREEEKKKREAEREEERKKREEKKKVKEEEKLAKEEERRKKEEEKEKKERSQMRLSSFFTRPSTDSTKPSNPVNSSPRKGLIQDVADSTASVTGTENIQSDYQKEFPDFFIQSHTQLAPPHRFQRDEKAKEHIRGKLDGFLKQEDARPAYRSSELFDLIPYRRRNGRNIIPVRTILKRLQNDVNDNASTVSTASPQHLLRKITMKSLKFGEDVRPPYYGTFTRPLSSAQALKLCRRPYARALPDVNYDYDSEGEWEEPEEGEDLDSDGEEEMSDDGEDDMDGFLDDEDEQIDGRRRLIIGDLEPVCTGIKWQDEGDIDPSLEACRIESISDLVRFPIDPFSTAYWPKPKAVEQAASKGHAVTSARGTLHAFSTNHSSPSQAPLVPTVKPGMSAESAAPSKAKKPFPPEQLAAFKEAVEGSDLTKAGLIEVLKKRFPKVSKDVLKDTLNLVAVRVGQKEADKKWVCK